MKYLIKKCEITWFNSNLMWYKEIELIQGIESAEYDVDNNELFDDMHLSYDSESECIEWDEGDEFYSHWNKETGEITISKELNQSLLNK